MNFQCFVHGALLGTVGLLSVELVHFAEAAESFEQSVRRVQSAHGYENGLGSYVLHCMPSQRRMHWGDEITVEVTIECISGGITQPLTNPFLDLSLPTCLVLAVFDSFGDVVATFPPAGTKAAQEKQFRALKETMRTPLITSETAGIILNLTTDAETANSERRLRLERPGKYTLQAICSRRMFANIPSVLADWDFLAKEFDSPAHYNCEACRSEPVEIVVSAEARFVAQPVDAPNHQGAPLKCRLSLSDSGADGAVRVQLRLDNVGKVPVYLSEPLMTNCGYTMMPLRFNLMQRNGEVVKDFADQDSISYKGPTPGSFVLLPTQGFIARTVSIPPKLVGVSYAVQVVYDDELFVTKGYAELFQDGRGRRPTAEDVEKNRRERAKFDVHSNVLRLKDP